MVLTPFEITHLSNYTLTGTPVTLVLTPFEITHLSNSWAEVQPAGNGFNTLRNYTPLKHTYFERFADEGFNTLRNYTPLKLTAYTTRP